MKTAFVFIIMLVVPSLAFVGCYTQLGNYAAPSVAHQGLYQRKEAETLNERQQDEHTETRVERETEPTDDDRHYEHRKRSYDSYILYLHDYYHHDEMLHDALCATST